MRWQNKKKEIERRIQTLRKGDPLPVLKNRIVILVDDGIATGATIPAGIRMCKNQAASRIIVGAPMSGKKMASQLKNEVDDVVILEIPEGFHAVSQVYFSFDQVTDEEASELLEKWKKENQPLGQQPPQKLINKY